MLTWKSDLHFARKAFAKIELKNNTKVADQIQAAFLFDMDIMSDGVLYQIVAWDLLAMYFEEAGFGCEPTPEIQFCTLSILQPNMLKLLKQTFAEFLDDKCTRSAAALSYYTIFSLAPLLTLGIAICGLVLDPEDVSGKIEQQVKSLIGSDGAEQIRTMISAAGDPKHGIVATVISTLLLIVGAIGLVGQLQSAMNEAWEVKPDPEKTGIKSFILKRVFSFGMLLAAGFLLLVSLLLSTLVAAFGGWLGRQLGDVSEPLLQVINVAVSFFVIAALFAAMFKYLPDAKINWRDVAVGALVTSLLFVAGKFALGLYLGSKNMESTYGAAGSLALILMWIYYTSIIFLLGAEFTQVWAKERGSGIEPSDFAVRIEQQTTTKV